MGAINLYVGEKKFDLERLTRKERKKLQRMFLYDVWNRQVNFARRNPVGLDLWHDWGMDQAADVAGATDDEKMVTKIRLILLTPKNYRIPGLVFAVKEMDCKHPRCSLTHMKLRVTQLGKTVFIAHIDQRSSITKSMYVSLWRHGSWEEKLESAYQAYCDSLVGNVKEMLSFHGSHFVIGTIFGTPLKRTR